MYFRGTTTVGELIAHMENFIGKLTQMEENDVISSDVRITTTDSCISDIAENHWEYELSEHFDEFYDAKAALGNIDPKILHEYAFDTEDWARDTDYFWERLYDYQRDYFRDNISEEVKKFSKIEEEKDATVSDNQRCSL